MAYGLLEVSQVGEAEYPLIGVLHEHIFDRPQAIAALSRPAADLLALMAHLEGNPVGFLVGHGDGEKRNFAVDQMGLLSAYRRQGLGGRMLSWAEEHARARGYRRIEFLITGIRCEGLAALGRRRGYHAQSSDGPAFRMIKVLTSGA